jgi:hypothetical protein
LGFVVGSLVFLLEIGLLSASRKLSAKIELVINHETDVNELNAGSHSMSFYKTFGFAAVLSNNYAQRLRLSEVAAFGAANCQASTNLRMKTELANLLRTPPFC